MFANRDFPIGRKITPKMQEGRILWFKRKSILKDVFLSNKIDNMTNFITEWLTLTNS